jgi:hypothetical protein
MASFASFILDTIPQDDEKQAQREEYQDYPSPRLANARLANARLANARLANAKSGNSSAQRRWRPFA